MANEGWSYATTGGAQACSMAPVTTHYLEDESATSATSTDFKPPNLHDGAAAASSSFLADPPHMDWTQAYMGGRAVTTSFNAALQHVQYDYNVGGMAPAAMLKPFTQQQFSSFSDPSGIFRPAAAAELPRIPSLVLESKHLESKTERVQEACSTVKRRSSVPDSPVAAKKPRIEPPPPLPTFKVRKEKLGDRITALQQLVSPFGKTDTASVLHEAIQYIKFLHNQVASLSSPYLRFGRHVQIPQQDSGKAKSGEAKEPLSSRGLCLVPLASTYTVANETALEFWHPTLFGGTFR